MARPHKNKEKRKEKCIARGCTHTINFQQYNRNFY